MAESAARARGESSCWDGSPAEADAPKLGGVARSRPFNSGSGSSGSGRYRDTDHPCAGNRVIRYKAA